MATAVPGCCCTAATSGQQATSKNTAHVFHSELLARKRRRISANLKPSQKMSSDARRARQDESPKPSNCVPIWPSSVSSLQNRIDCWITWCLCLAATPVGKRGRGSSGRSGACPRNRHAELIHSAESINLFSTADQRPWQRSPSVVTDGWRRQRLVFRAPFGGATHFRSDRRLVACRRTPFVSFGFRVGFGSARRVGGAGTCWPTGTAICLQDLRLAIFLAQKRRRRCYS